MSEAVVSAEMPLRVMALHALLYCPRLFYLEEVEEIRVADAAVYAGRELHESLAAEEGESWEKTELSSPTLGLFGKIDCLKRRDGSLIPYEHKRGRCRRGEGNEAMAWPADRVQAAAYAMMLEENLGKAVPEARVHYHADNVTVRVPLDEAVRKEVTDAIAWGNVLRQSLERPAIAENENLCRRCSLAPVCLPEEVRQDQEVDHRAQRLFPPDDQRTSLHVMTQGASVGRSGDCLVIRIKDAPDTKHPSNEVSAVLLHGFSQISTQAIRLCTEKEIAVHWLGAGGGHIASLASTPGQVQRRIRQYQALSDPPVRLRLVRQLAAAKVEGQHRYLLRATREDETVRREVAADLQAISDEIQAISRAGDADSIRGHEGAAAVRYFAALKHTLGESVPQELRYCGRSRRPPVDRFSAMLNFGYALLETAVMRGILAAGLEPALGFYHTPRSAAHPLVLDLMELFRVSLWDLVLIGSLNRGQWDVSADFAVTKTKVWLSDEGRKKAIGLFEDRLQEQWKHPVVDYSLSYARTIELEARLLEKEWSGEAGLFARLRLR